MRDVSIFWNGMNVRASPDVFTDLVAERGTSLADVLRAAQEAVDLEVIAELSDELHRTHEEHTTLTATYAMPRDQPCVHLYVPYCMVHLYHKAGSWLWFSLRLTRGFPSS